MRLGGLLTRISSEQAHLGILDTKSIMPPWTDLHFNTQPYKKKSTGLVSIASRLPAADLLFPFIVVSSVRSLSAKADILVEGFASSCHSCLPDNW